MDYFSYLKRTFSTLFVVTVFLAVFFCLLPSPGRAADDTRGAMVKIYTVMAPPDYNTPWRLKVPRSSSASGCIIEGKRILTNAHAVADHTFIQVRRHGSPRKATARVVAVSHAMDLALLTVDEGAFFEGVAPLEFGDLPMVQQDVVVYGFPTGGDTLSTTRGVISRIEHRRYVHSSRNLLAVQIDAAINPGNSGGPVMRDNRIVGVAMQSIRGAENIGYIVPTPVVRHFLADLEDDRLDGIPVVGFRWQTLENEALKRKYRLPGDRTGILVKAVTTGSPAEGHLEKGDIVLSVDGHPVADDGTVEFRPAERTSMNYFVQQHQLGEKVTLGLFRNGSERTEEIPLDAPLSSIDLVSMEQYDRKPSYFIFGGLVFSPLTKNYLKEWGNNWYTQAPRNLVALYDRNLRTEKGEQVVNLLGVLPAELNKGYHHMDDYRVSSVDGKHVTNLKGLVEIVESGRDEKFVTFELEDGTNIVLERGAAEKSQEEILGLYQITSDRSQDLQ